MVEINLWLDETTKIKHAKQFYDELSEHKNLFNVIKILEAQSKAHCNV